MATAGSLARLVHCSRPSIAFKRAAVSGATCGSPEWLFELDGIELMLT